MIDEGELIGELFQVPDKWWGFEAFGRMDHPGACHLRFERRTRSDAVTEVTPG